MFDSSISKCCLLCLGFESSSVTIQNSKKLACNTAQYACQLSNVKRKEEWSRCIIRVQYKLPTYKCELNLYSHKIVNEYVFIPHSGVFGYSFL